MNRQRWIIRHLRNIRNISSIAGEKKINKQNLRKKNRYNQGIKENSIRISEKGETSVSERQKKNSHLNQEAELFAGK